MKLACFENFSPIAETAMLKEDSAFLIEHIRLVAKYSEEVNSALEKLGKEDGWRSWRKEESLRCTSRISTVIMIILIFI